jgi:hypothetical protein
LQLHLPHAITQTTAARKAPKTTPTSPSAQQPYPSCCKPLGAPSRGGGGRGGGTPPVAGLHAHCSAGNHRVLHPVTSPAFTTCTAPGKLLRMTLSAPQAPRSTASCSNPRTASLGRSCSA